MSNIFRGHHLLTGQSPQKEIVIRNLSFTEEVQQEESCSLEQILAERDRLLDQAKRSIEQEKIAIEQMRQTANDDIVSMQTAWELEKQALQQRAYDEGFQVGYEEGRNKALADMTESLHSANEVTKLSYQNASKYLVSQERVILDIAIKTAERIIGMALDDDGETYLSIVRRGLKEAREMKEVKLYVSLDYFELVSTNRSELAAIFPPDIPFLIFANDDFNSTQCYIETNQGRIVVSIDEQLNELKERLVEIMESGD